LKADDAEKLIPYIQIAATEQAHSNKSFNHSFERKASTPTIHLKEKHLLPKHIQ